MFWRCLFLFILFYLLGVYSAVWVYHGDYQRLKEICTPYDCQTDTECEEDEEKKRQLWESLAVKSKPRNDI